MERSIPDRHLKRRRRKDAPKCIPVFSRHASSRCVAGAFWDLDWRKTRSAFSLRAGDLLSPPTGPPGQ